MGKNSYDQEFYPQYANQQIYVATTKNLKDYNNIHFIKEDITKKILQVKEESEGDIYLFGGGKLIDPFIKEKLIDEYIIGIIPVILGSGIPLFLKNNPMIPLELQNYYIQDGIIIMRYIPKK